MNEDELRREFERLATAKPYEFDIDRYVEDVQPADLAGKYADETTQDAWELFQSGAAWADARARRESADVAESQRRVFPESAWAEGYNDACNDIEKSILATIKEPAP